MTESANPTPSAERLNAAAPNAPKPLWRSWGPWLLGGVIVGGAGLGLATRVLAPAKLDDSAGIMSDPTLTTLPVVSADPKDAVRFLDTPGVVGLRTVTTTILTPRHWFTPARTETQVAAYIEIDGAAWPDLERQLGPPKGHWTRRMGDMDALRIMSAGAVLSLPKEDGDRIVAEAEYDLTKLKRGFSVGATGWRIGPVLMVWQTLNATGATGATEPTAATRAP